LSRSQRRLSFAAPLILVAACTPTGGGDTTTTRNPPQPEPPYSQWNVSMYSGECSADDATPFDCPPDASCNPPPPMPVECPAGLEEGGSVLVIQQSEDGPCTVDGTETACPAWEEGE
jgi:hypothetical protein